MHPFYLLAPLALILTSCGPSVITEKPDIDSLVGEYEARMSDDTVSSITLSKGGNFSGLSVPVRRMNSDIIIFRTLQTSWELVDPSITPSGTWCVEADGNFFRIYEDGDQITLRLPYDVLRNKRAIYTRTKP